MLLLLIFSANLPVWSNLIVTGFLKGNKAFLCSHEAGMLITYSGIQLAIRESMGKTAN